VITVVLMVFVCHNISLHAMDDIYDDLLEIKPAFDINFAVSDHGTNYVHIQSFFLNRFPDNRYQLYYKAFENSDHLIRYSCTQPQSSSNFHFRVTSGYDYEFFIVAVNDQGDISGRTFLNKFQSSTLLRVQNFETTSETNMTNRKRQSNDLTFQLDIAHQAFPLINLYTRISLNNQPFDGKLLNKLTASNFTIREDQRIQSIYRFIPPDVEGLYRIVDIVFVIDDSGSMSYEASAVKEAVTSFATKFEENNIDYRIGLLPYGGGGRNSDPKGTIKNNGNLTKIEDFKDEVSNMKFDGGAEYSYLAMNKALNQYQWRSNAQQLLFLITDEPDHGTSFGNTNYAESDIIEEITQRSNLSVYIVCTSLVLNSYDNFDLYQSMRVYKEDKSDLVSKFNSIFDEINNEIANDYIIQYQSDNLINDHDNNCRNVELMFTYEDPNTGRLADRVSSKYCLNQVIKIKRTPETEQLSTYPQRNKAPLEIGAFIDMQNQSDAATSSFTMTLNYAQCDTDTYKQISMRLEDNEPPLFQGTIPAQEVIQPCIKYYLMATGHIGQPPWNIGKITFPADRPYYTPAVISIMPNIPPIITHQKPVISFNSDTVEIKATVEDVTEKLTNVTLFYRQKGDFIYQSISKNTDKTYMDFNERIPLYDETPGDQQYYSDGLQYYIVATDNYNGTSQVGSAEVPIDLYVPIPTPDSNQLNKQEIGNVIVYANEFQQDNQDPYLTHASGNVMIGTTDGNVPLIKTTTSLIMNRNTRTIYSLASGDLIALNVKRDTLEAMENIPLYFGKYEIDCLNNPSMIHLKAGTSRLEMIQDISFYYETTSQNITLESDQITLHNLYTQLDQGFYAQLSLGDIVLSQSQNTTKQCQYTGSDSFVHERSKSMSISNLNFLFDLLEQNYQATGELTISQIIGTQNQGLDANFECRQNPFSIQTISGAFEYANAPQTKVYLPQESNYSLKTSVSNGLYWIDNLQNTLLLPVLKGYGEITFEDDEKILSTISQAAQQAFFHGNLSYTIDASAKTLMSGDMWFFDHIHVSNGQLQFGIPYQIKGYMDYQNILSGHLNVSLWHSENRVELTGLNMLDWKIPLSTPFIGGFLLNNQLTYPLVQLTLQGIDHSAFISNYPLFFMNIGLCLNMNDTSNIQIMGWDDITPQIEITKDANQIMFSLNQTYPQIVIALQSEKSTADFNLQLPDKTSYAPENVSPFLGNDSQFAMDVDNIFFVKNSYIHESLYGLNLPAEGNYQLKINNADRIGSYQMKFMKPNQLPSIQLLQLSTTTPVQSGQTVTIKWLDKDDDDNAIISLYLDNDMSGANGILIKSNIDENHDSNKYEWTVPDHIPDGTYYVYAMIFDNHHAPVFSYCPGPLHINNENGSNIPEYVVAIPEEWGTRIYWNPVSETNILGYRLYVTDQTDNNNIVYDFAAGTDTTYALYDLKKGQNYDVSVSSVNSQGMESELSQSQSFVSQTNGEGGNPDLCLNSKLSTIIFEQDHLAISAQIENIGNNDAYSARISCYYGSVLPENLISSKMISQIDAQKMQNVPFHYQEQSGIKGGKDIYITIDNGVPHELNIENNNGIIDNNTLFNEKNGLLFQSTNGYSFEIMPHSDYAITFLNTIPLESITNTTQKPEDLLYDLIRIKMTGASVANLELILPDAAPDRYRITAYTPEKEWKTIQHSSDASKNMASIMLSDNAVADLDSQPNEIDVFLGVSSTTDSEISKGEVALISSDDSSSCFISSLFLDNYFKWE